MISNIIKIVKQDILKITLTILFAVSGLSSFAQLRLISPSNNSVVQNNMPLLSWKAVDCDYYQIWIDGIIMDSIHGDQNSFVPFPLSFGAHEWTIKAIKSAQVLETASARFTIDDTPLAQLPANALLLRSNWMMGASAEISMDGKLLSSQQISEGRWYPTSLPATVLSVLSRNGVYPNPYKGMNNMRIPDMNDSANLRDDLLKYSHLPGENPWKKPYWYINTFEIGSIQKEKIIWLVFNEINYRAEIWLNGNQIASPAEVVGMEQQFRFDISKYVHFDQPNYLAVAIHPPDHPGMPVKDPVQPLEDPGQNMADGMISRDYTKWDVLGWDWQPVVRDRDMGITEDVFVFFSDAIAIDNIYVSSDLPLPDTSFAELTVSYDLINYSNVTLTGESHINIGGHHHPINIHVPFKILPFDTISVVLQPQEYAELRLQNPVLWWPASYGQQNLHSISIESHAVSGELDKKQLTFGIREVHSRMGNSSRIFSVNGQDIFCKAGNWVIDMMLNWTAQRYEEEILLSKNAGLNLLRVWGPTGAPPEAFYAAADKHGILLWQDFLNDFWGTFKNTPGYQPEIELYEKATISIIKKYRNHPSLIIWCGGNEGVNPREKLITGKLLPLYDSRDSKYYLNASDGDGLHGGGPYHTIAPADYFTHHKLQGFSSEIGPSGIPVAESVAKFMPLMPEKWADGRFPLDGNWAFHDANNWPGEDTRKFTSYDDLVRGTYGPPDSVSENGVLDYLEKCQLVNYEVYKAAIESVNHQMWSNSTGIALWKSNSSWPSMVWQLYDWFLQAHAGYYAAAIANEPLHIQFNHNDKSIIVLNTKSKTYDELVVTASLYNSGLRKVWEKKQAFLITPQSVTPTGWKVPQHKKLHYLKLTLSTKSGDTLADNFYWLYKKGPLNQINELPQSQMQVECKKLVANDGSYQLEVTNNGSTLAFMVAFRLVGKESGKEILPSYWSANYLNLLPGESKVLQLKVNPSDLHEEVIIEYRPYNHDPVNIEITSL